MLPMLVYLAGCISYYNQFNQIEKAITWRQKATQYLIKKGFTVFDPTRNFNKNISSFFSPSLIVKQNMVYLAKASIILVNLNDLSKSPGTLFEIYYGYLHGKPIISFGYDSIVESPHVKVCLDVNYSSLEEALECVASYFF